jgi:molecular chaperone DnaK (HSP70)
MVSLSAQSVVAPALVYLAEDGTISTGDAARRRAITEPDRVGREFKRRLGDPTPIKLGHESFAVTELLGALLRDVLRQVIRLEREPPEQVVLTHPANWGPFRRGLFEEVPAIAELGAELSAADLSNTVMISEPAAAAAHLAAARYLHDGQIVGVYDLGGGTFDATILRGGPDGVEILRHPEGIERLGGVDFDESVLEYVNYSTGGALDALDMTDPHTARAVARLRQDCVLAKESLSHDTETTIPVFLPDRHFEVTLLEPSDLSAVLLVGGSSRIPLVAELVGRELGCRTLVDTHPKFTVALGAAATTLRRHRAGPTSATVAPGIASAPMAEPAAVATSGRVRASVATEAVQPLKRDLPAGSPPAHAAPPNTRNWVLALSIAMVVLVAILVIV